MSADARWALVLATAGACFAVKLLGLSAPRSLLDRASAARIAGLLPVALLAALAAVQTASSGRQLTIDARVAGVAAAIAALALRANILVAVSVAAAVAAGLRALS